MYQLDKKIDKLSAIFNFYYICPICISRLFYDKNIKYSPIKFGKILLKKYIEKASDKSFFKESKLKTCYLCNNILLKIKKIVIQIVDRLEFYDFSTFSVGIKISEKLIAREDRIRSRFEITSGFSLKSFFNFTVSKLLERILKKKAVSLEPDIRIIYDSLNDIIEIIPSAIYIYGRYLKLKRNIRQTREYCKFCKGSGCMECRYSGYTEDPSIEGFILEEFTKRFLGDSSVLHAAGREDIDVITINTGRPFVVEIKRPIKRNVDLKEIENSLNEKNEGFVLIKNLRYVKREVMEKINVFSRYDEKTYRLLVEFKGDFNKKMLENLEKEFTNRVIAQRTPLRVLYRRVDKVRYKTIYEMKARRIDERRVEFLIRCQGGLYIKELAHGDQGRTIPSIHSVSGIPLEVISLDVVSIAPELEKRLGLD